MVPLNLSRTIKDGPDGCLIGVDGVQGYQSSVVRPEKNASVSNRGIKSSLAMSDDYSEYTKTVKRGRLTLLKIRAAAVAQRRSFLDDDERCKVGLGLGS